MAINWDVISRNIINISEVLNDFLDTENPKKVTWVYMEEDGSVKEKQVDNLATVINYLKENSVTDDELTDKLRDFYTKGEVNKIADSIKAMFDNYYTKTNIEDIVDGIKGDFNEKLAQYKEEINKIVEDGVTRSKVMTEAEYRALQEVRRKQFAGSGFVKWGGINSLRDWYIKYGIWGASRTYEKPNVFYLGQNPNDPGGAILPPDRSFIPVVNLNGNLVALNSVGTDFSTNLVKLPEPPTVKAVVRDSKSLPVDLKQGDFIILKDFDRELIVNGTFDSGIEGWSSLDGDKISYDDENKQLLLNLSDAGSYIDVANDNDKKLISGVKYRIKFSALRDKEQCDKILVRFYYPVGYEDKVIYFTKTNEFEDFEFDFVGKKTVNLIRFFFHTTDENEDITIKLDNVSVKQVEEQPVVCLMDMDKGIDIYEYGSKFEARDSISRQDLVFLEYWEEHIEEKDIIYPYGNTQYRGDNVDDVPGITEGDFPGADTYSLFGTWQEPGELVGKGYKWSQLTDEQKTILASNPDHNIFLSRDGKWTQGRYRIRVVKGSDNGSLLTWNRIIGNFGPRPEYLNYKLITPQGKAVKPLDYTYRNGNFIYWDIKLREGYFNASGSYIDSKLVTDGEGDYKLDVKYRAIPIALVQRRNDGIFNKVLNPEGTAVAYDKNDDRMLNLEEYALDTRFVGSLEDCFDTGKIAAVTEDESVVPADDSSTKYRTGYIASKISGHEAGLYADEVNQMDVEDLRMNANRKPLAEILEEEKLKDIVGERRGKENSKNYVVISEKVLYTGSASKAKSYDGYVLYIGRGTDDYGLIHKGKTLMFKPGTIVGVSDGKNFIKLMVKSNGYRMFRITFNHNTSGSSGMPWGAGYEIDMMLMLPEDRSYVYNNTYIQTDIIGDPRPLKDRVEYTTVSGDDQKAVINKNTYVKANGKYYRSLVDRGEITIDPDTEDYSNTDNWVDLGDDGEIGGYPKEWLEKGLNGTPLLVSEEGDSLLPTDVGIDVTYGDQFYKLSKKYFNTNGIYKVLVSDKDGNFMEFKNKGREDVSRADKLSYLVDSGKLIQNIINLNIVDSYNDLGYSSEQEMLDLMKVIVVYETKADFMELANNDHILHKDNEVRFFNSAYYGYGVYAVQSLINKIPTGDGSYNNDTSILLNPRLARDTFDPRSWGGGHLVNSDFYLQHDNSPTVKFTRYLTQHNNRLYLQYVFKELKYDSNISSWGDDNKFQIVDNATTVTDLNGKRVLIGQKRVPLPYFYNNN